MRGQSESQFENCFFAVRCLDMWGGDVDHIKGFKSEDEAKEAVKSKLKENINYCATIVKEDNGTYRAYIKYKTKTNPSKNGLRWHNSTTVFYGKKVIHNSENSKGGKMNQRESRLDYFLVEGLDMFGGDFEKRNVGSFQEGLATLKDIIRYETALCGMIADERVEKKQWSIYIKDPRKCNPSFNSVNHPTRTTLFVGFEI